MIDPSHTVTLISRRAVDDRIDMFEQVFEHGFMTGTSAVDRARPPVTALGQARMLLARAKAQKAAQVQELDETAEPVRLRQVVPAPRTTETRVQQALDTAAVDRVLPTLPAISELLAGPGLRGGSAYSVRGSSALVMAMMAGPSAEGAWCGVVGLPSFGAEAARGLGVDLDRLVLVPDPEHDWLNVVAALVDALTVVVVRPPGEVTPGEASRLAARLRTRGVVLIAVGSWPGSEARLEVESNTWTGLGSGEGLLAARQATVVVTGRRAAGRQRKHQLWLPGPDGAIRSVESADPLRSVDPRRSVDSRRSVDPLGEEAPRWQDEAVG
jgi:hypothetical protein